MFARSYVIDAIFEAVEMKTHYETKLCLLYIALHGYTSVSSVFFISSVISRDVSEGDLARAS